MGREGDSDSDLDRKVVFKLAITKGNISTRLLDSRVGESYESYQWSESEVESGVIGSCNTLHERL